MGMPNAEVLWVARYDYPAGWGMTIPHQHDYYQIYYVIDGRGELSLHDKVREMGPEKFFLMTPYCVHQLLKVESSALKTFDIKFLVHNSEWAAQLKKAQPEMVMTNPDVPALFKKIREEGMKKSPHYKEFSTLYLGQLLLSLLRFQADQALSGGPEAAEIETASESNRICQQVVDYVKQHYKDELSLQEISAALGYNSSYICQIFKSEKKNTVMRYLYQYRVKKAGELITYSDYDLKEIAALTGFKTVHHFTRLFHEFQGVTPGQWRDREREGIRKGIFIDESFKNQNMIHQK